MFKRKYFYMNEADASGGDLGGGSSILAGVGNQQEPTPPVETQQEPAGNDQEANAFNWLPEKFRVKTSDGLEIDPIESAKKMAASYEGLSKRLGTGDIPPKSAEDYDITIESETLKFDDFKKDPENQAFLTKALEQGMTSKQVEFILNEYARVMPAALNQFKELTVEQAYTELTNTWKTEAEFNSNLKDAFTAFTKYASPEDKEKIDEIGNNPVVIRLLANMGKNLREDAPPVRNEAVEQENVQNMMRTEAYRNPSHPDHRATHAKVRQYYEANFGTQSIG